MSASLFWLSLLSTLVCRALVCDRNEVTSFSVNLEIFLTCSNSCAGNSLTVVGLQAAALIAPTHLLLELTVEG